MLVKIAVIRKVCKSKTANVVKDISSVFSKTGGRRVVLVSGDGLVGYTRSKVNVILMMLKLSCYPSPNLNRQSIDLVHLLEVVFPYKTLVHCRNHIVGVFPR